MQSYLGAIDAYIYSAVTDINGMVVKINQSFLLATGYCYQELVGKSLSILNSNIHSADVTKQIYQTISSGNTWRGEMRNKAKDGSIFWIDMVIFPLKNENGIVNYYLTLAMPITERKELENKRMVAIDMLETVTFRTSHNVRGPLARILGLMSLLKKNQISIEEITQVAERLVESSSELDLSIRELTSFVNEHHDFFNNDNLSDQSLIIKSAD